MLRRLLVVALLLIPSQPAPAEESSNRLDDAKASLVQLAAWFEALPPDERAEVAQELRRWLLETYGSEVPFPFAMPSEEEIASWQEGETPSAAVEPAADSVPQSAPSAEATPAVTAEATTTPGTPSPATSLPKAPLPRTAQPPSRCNTLTLLDTENDGVLNGLDRFWRHLYLWFDSDGDRKPADGEMMAPFERRIREISLDLRYFVAGKGKKAGRGEIETDDYILFDTGFDGFSATLFPARDDAALAIDADALRRDPRGFDVRDASGAEVTGIQPFAAGWTLTTHNGVSVAIDCPG